MMDYPGKAFFYHQFFNQFRSDLENGSLCSFITAWFMCSMITRLVLINAVLCCCVCPQRTLCCCCVRPSSGKCLSVSSRRSGWSWQERTQTTPIQWKVDCSTRHPTTSTAGKSMSLLLSVCLVCVCFIHS